MATNYVQDGKVLDHTAGSAITSGSAVVMQNIIGVALADIASGAVGAVQIDGVFTLPKVAGVAWVQGDKLDWDASGAAFTVAIGTPATGDITDCAIAAAAAASGDTTAAVLLGGIPGPVT